MAIYPGAKYRPVVGLEKDPPIIPVGVILHVAASNADSLYGYFNGPSGGIESHFQIPLTNKAPVEQYRDTGREADANYKGNSWIGADGRRYGFLSVETAGLGDGEWNAHQLTEIIALIRWASKTHGFPLRKAPGYRSPGLGYHIMFGSGEGTNSWSNARGKVCPGPKRIRQFEEIILPTLARPTAPTPPPAPEEDMTGPAIVSWGPGREDAFYKGADGALWQYWLDGTDTGHQKIGGAITSSPSVYAPAPNRLVVVARGADDAIWRFEWNGIEWAWRSIGGKLSK